MSGDIYDIMVKDLMARRQAEEDSDEDEDEDDSSDSDSSSEDEEDREVLRRKLAEDNEDDEDGSLIRERERKRQMEEAIRGAPAEEGEDENEQPKAKEVSAVLSMKAEGGSSPQRLYAIDRKWVSTSTLPPLPRQQPQPKETRSSPNASTSTSPTSSGSSFLGLRKKDSKEEKTTDWKKRSKDAKEEESSACQDATGKVKMRKRDIIRGQWGNAFLSLREEKEEIKGKLNEWRSQRHDEKKEKETDKELRKRTKEETKKKKREESEKKTNKDDAEWEKKDRKAAEAYAKRYGLDCTFDDRPRDGTKCYTSFGENESDDDDQTPLARAPQPPPLVGGRP